MIVFVIFGMIWFLVWGSIVFCEVMFSLREVGLIVSMCIEGSGCLVGMGVMVLCVVSSMNVLRMVSVMMVMGRRVLSCMIIL